MTLHAPAPLDAHHALDAFDSGAASLDEWLKRRARANQAGGGMSAPTLPAARGSLPPEGARAALGRPSGGASRVYVVAEDTRVIAYYALAFSSIAARAASGRLRCNMPDPIPVVTLARLAVDRAFQRRGLGRDLVQDAARRVLAAADIIGIRGMIVHAIDDRAQAFYLGRGFVPSPISEMTLMIALTDLRGCL